MNKEEKMPGVVIIPFKNLYVVKGFSDAAKEKFAPTPGEKYACYTKCFGALNGIIAVCLLSGISWRIEKELHV